MDSTLVSEADDPGSIPGESTKPEFLKMIQKFRFFNLATSDILQRKRNRHPILLSSRNLILPSYFPPTTNNIFHLLNYLMELSGTDIQVSCIEPGLVMTELHKHWEVHPKESMNIQEPLDVSNIVDAVLYIISQPAHVRIPKLMILPKDHHI